MGSRIERVHSYKILGIILSHDLTWNAHVDYISKRPTNGCTPFACSSKPVFPRVTVLKCILALYEVYLNRLYQHGQISHCT